MDGILLLYDSTDVPRVAARNFGALSSTNRRLQGTDTSIMVLPPDDGSQDYERAFVAQFKRE